MSNVKPVIAMICAIYVIAFLGGTVSAHFKAFPYPNIRDAGRTLLVLIGGWRPDHRYFGDTIEQTAIPASDAPRARWTVLDTSAPRLPVIVNGGLNQFLDLCPDQGCLAVAFDAEGNVIQAWPYRPVDIYATDITHGAYPHEMLAFDPRIHVYPVSVQRYADGDLLVNFQARGDKIFPFGMGVARVGPDGKSRWTRFDFSHHWSTLGADGIAYVPSLKVGDSSLRFTIGAKPSPWASQLPCRTGRPQLDTVQKIDGAGGVVEEIDLVPILLQSNWAAIVPETSDFCDPLHLNYIDEIGADAGPGLAAGDLVLSLRNLSRFVIFDPKTHRIKRTVAGGFIQQHSVQHLSGSKFLIFDNQGGDALGPPSRIVERDLATGVERRIFPNADTPKAYAQVFSREAGYLSISPDRRRVLASFSHAGRAFEVDIASGRLLAVYDNVHDVSSAPGVPEDGKKNAWRFDILGLGYSLQDRQRRAAVPQGGE